MRVRMEIIQNGKLVEEYIVPDGSWIQTDSMGAQYVCPVAKRELINGGNGCQIFCSPVNELPDIPEELLKMVNGRDKRWGKNGHEWLGRNRERQGGTEIDRIREHANNLLYMYGENPLALSEEVLSRLAKV